MVACQADNTLSKANRASQFDAAKNLHVEMISQGMESAISSGNWTIRRFRMERKGVTQVLLPLSFPEVSGDPFSVGNPARVLVCQVCYCSGVQGVQTFL